MSGRPIRPGQRIAYLAEQKEVSQKAIAYRIKANLTLTSLPHWMIMGIRSEAFAIAGEPIASTRNT